MMVESLKTFELKIRSLGLCPRFCVSAVFTNNLDRDPSIRRRRTAL